jgi:hypothetical protein
VLEEEVEREEEEECEEECDLVRLEFLVQELEPAELVADLELARLQEVERRLEQVEHHYPPLDLVPGRLVERPEVAMQVEEEWVAWKVGNSAHQTLLSHR